MDDNQQNNINKNNLDALNNAINKNINPSDFYNNNNKHDSTIIKLIIILITLILIISIVIGVVFTFRVAQAQNSTISNITNNTTEQDDDITKESKVINNTIVEDSTASLNRKYGRIDVSSCS